jgi:hypothetical protein
LTDTKRAAKVFRAPISAAELICEVEEDVEGWLRLLTDGATLRTREEGGQWSLAMIPIAAMNTLAKTHRIAGSTGRR